MKTLVLVNMKRLMALWCVWWMSLFCSVSSRRATCWQATTTQQRRTMTSSGPCPSVSSHSNSLVSSVFSSSLNGGWCFPHTSEPIVFCFPFSNYRFVVWLLWRQEGASELFDSFFFAFLMLCQRVYAVCLCLLAVCVCFCCFLPFTKL